MKGQKILFVLAIVVLGASYYIYQQAQIPHTRLNTFVTSFKAIYNMKPDDIDRFMKSYWIYQEEKMTNVEQEKYIVDYYNVLNFLCSLGDVEKMYIPPVINPNEGIFGNQLEYEKQIIKYLGVKINHHVLDVGCGRGAVASNIQKSTGAKITGFNIDPTQLRLANQRAKNLKQTDKLSFVKASFNEKLPFADSSFDGLYTIQTLSLCINYTLTFNEMYRVLKPGAKLSFLEWFVYDAYDPSNNTHVELMRRNKGIIGAVYNPTPREMVKALEEAGFKVEVNENASIDGHQYSLIEKADIYFTTLQTLIKILVKIKVLPEHFNLLMNRLTQDADSFLKGDKMGLWTSCHQITASKPVNV